MNYNLQREIIKHIFSAFGFLVQEVSYKGFIEPLKVDKFLLDKKIVFETDDRKKFEKQIWASTAKVEVSTIRVLAADVSEDTEEYVVVVQMNDFPPFAMRLAREDDSGDFHFLVAEKWVQANITMQARILTGIEGLAELYLNWEKLSEYEHLYKALISYMNFNE